MVIGLVKYKHKVFLSNLQIKSCLELNSNNCVTICTIGQLNPKIVTLFGCAFSHIHLWKKLQKSSVIHF